jgi:hypothetical protein
LLRVVVKATVRSSSEAASKRTGDLRKGSIFEALAVVLVSADDGDGSRLRVECEKGWLSTVSSNGVVLCENVSDLVDIKPKLLWDPVKAKTTDRGEAALESEPDPEATGMTKDELTGIVSYDAKQGRTKLQLQVGSMALQVFKGGKPIDNILFKDMKNWQVRNLAVLQNCRYHRA